jgi:hypothetical protein
MFDKNYSKIRSLNFIFLTDFSLYNLFLFLLKKGKFFLVFIFIDFLIKLKIKKRWFITKNHVV